MIFEALKETELARLKYAAIDEAYLGDGQAYCSTITSVRNKMRAMAILEEMIMVRGITNGASMIKRRWQFMLSAAASKMDWVCLSATRSFLDVRKIYTEVNLAGGGLISLVRLLCCF